MKKSKIKKYLSTILVIFVLTLLLGIPVSAVSSTQVITLGGTGSSDPLKINVYNNGALGLFFWQIDPSDPDPNNKDYYEQYFSEDAWGTNIFFTRNSESRHYTTDYYYHANGSSDTDIGLGAMVQNGNSVTTTWQLDEGAVTFEQVITYVPGSRMYTKVFSLKNNSAIDYTDVKLIHGGDTYFGYDDDATSYWNDLLRMVYVRNNDMTLFGLMGFAGTQATPADHYYSGYYYDGREYAYDGLLPDTADNNFEDAGYQLQWNHATLAAGATWTINTFEMITEPNALQIIAPANQNAERGQTLTYDFIVQNFSTEQKTLNLAAVSEHGWVTDITTDENVTLAENGASANVTVTVVVPADAASLLDDTLTLTATDSVDTNLTVNGITHSLVKEYPPVVKTVTPADPEVMQGDASLAVTIDTDEAAEGAALTGALLDSSKNPLNPAITATGTVDAAGNGTLTFILPEQLPLGTYYISVSVAGGQAANETATITVIPADVEDIPATGETSAADGISVGSGVLLLALAGAALMMRRRLSGSAL